MGERMSREGFRRWLEERPDGLRFERVAGEPVAMSPEPWAHASLKAHLWRLLAQEIARAGLPCLAMPDGMTVEIEEDTDYEPDASVHCGPPPPADTLAVPNPVIVAEVVSPASRGVDTGKKLADYFRRPSILHYLVLLTDRRTVIHHRREEQGGIATAILAGGMLLLDPPGLVLDIEALYMAALPPG